MVNSEQTDRGARVFKNLYGELRTDREAGVSKNLYEIGGDAACGADAAGGRTDGIRKKRSFSIDGVKDLYGLSTDGGHGVIFELQ